MGFRVGIRSCEEPHPALRVVLFQGRKTCKAPGFPGGCREWVLNNVVVDFAPLSVPDGGVVVPCVLKLNGGMV